MANGNGNKISVDTLLKISQVAVIPLIGIMLWFLILLGKMDARLSVVEAIALTNPNASAEIAVLKNRQEDLRNQMSELKHDVERHIRRDEIRDNGRNR